jgi:dipeptidyl aminopeptidase/acylaminoacyl peptidase
VRAALATAALAVACGPVGPVVEPAELDVGAPTSIIASERGAGGTRLVFVGEDGRRMADLTPPAADVGYRVDVQPAWSPDGRWVAFASTRGRRGGRRTSLWLAEARPDAEPVRITFGEVTDRDPAWSPDGNSIVFASDRAGGFDLWRLDLDLGARPAVTTRVRLTAIQGDAVAPDVGPDGTAVFAVIEHRTRTSTLWLVPSAGGPARQLTAGPLDRDPAWSPDGRWIALAALAGGGDLELMRMRPDGSERALVAAEPLADERAPAWSRDGRHLFAIAELRARASGAPFFAAMIAVGVDGATDQPPRLLVDPVVLPRVDLALGPAAVDAGALAANPPFVTDAVLAALGDLCLDDDAREPAPLCEALRGAGR